jgi:phage shock protein A
MSIVKRLTRIISANVNVLIEKAEDPESMLTQLIREMDETIITLRNEIAKAITSEKRLGLRVEETKKHILLWQANTEKAVTEGNDDMARKALEKKLEEEKKLPELMAQHKKSLEVSALLKDQLREVENKIQDARRKKELLVARKRSAQAEMAVQSATHDISGILRKSDELLGASAFTSSSALNSLEDEVTRLEIEAEAMREVMKKEPTLEQTFEKSMQDSEVEKQLAELKKKLGK